MAPPAGRLPTRRRVRACSRTWCASSRLPPTAQTGSAGMPERCAVIGVGPTRHASKPIDGSIGGLGWKRSDVSIAGLVREAALAALADAGLGWADVDAVVIGKAPDMFEGVMMPGLYLADALGSAGKPMLRVHTAGSVGGSTAIVA